MVREAIEKMIDNNFKNGWREVFEYCINEKDIYRGWGIVDAIVDTIQHKCYGITEYNVISEDFEDTTNYASGVVFIAWIENNKLETMSYRWVSY